MSHYRIGCHIQLNDPYWVQLNEAIFQRANQIGLNLIPLEGDVSAAGGEMQAAQAEALLSRELDALIGWNLPDGLILHLLAHGLPIIHLHERSIRHPLFVSPGNLYSAGKLLATYLAEQLNEQGHILMVGGLAYEPERGQCRIDGFCHGLAAYPAMRVHHLPCVWRYEQAYPHILETLQRHTAPIDAIYGLSDSLALAGRDAVLELGLIDQHLPVVGINGDPLALAAIAQGRMSATVDTFVAEYGHAVAEMALCAARGEPLPDHVPERRRLVTAQNIAEVASQKLIGIAELPTRLVGINVQQERQRRIQLETSLAINRQIGAILDRHELSHTLADLIRGNYGYDHVQMFLWSEAEQTLTLDSSQGARSLPLAHGGVLAQVIACGELVFIPDTLRSNQFARDGEWPQTRSRVVLPMRIGGMTIGLLDLHNERVMHHTEAELIGLQVLADQVAIALRNADLVSEALAARATAEKADRLKTQLLANVSHELRTPLNVILGYSQAALSSPRMGYELAPELRRDIQYIYNSGDHLMRLINDLLDLSRAEIDELDLFPETIDTGAFLRDVFNSYVQSAPTERSIAWRLELDGALPLIQADPLRLRQILLNLLSNAAKFTEAGEVELGAALEPPYLHLWVRDTGVGIAEDQRGRIFEPFVTSDMPGRRSNGIGLGLCITKQLVLLHRGTIGVESAPGRGSTFHMHLPLPALNGQMAHIPLGHPKLLLVGGEGAVAPAILDLCQRQHLDIRRLGLSDDLDALLGGARPAAIGWDIATASAGDWTLIERLRAHPQLCQLPFLLFCSSADEGSGVGLTQVLTKPTRSETLAEMIGSLRKDETGAVLIVDDEPHARALYERLIQETLPGYTVYSADGGRAALELLDHVAPSLVVLDLSMPEMDGFGLLAHLRARDDTRNTPVIVVSSRVLSLDDVRQLNHARVTLQTKDVLTTQEAAETLRQAIRGDLALPQHTSTLVKRAVAYLQRHYHRPLSRQEIADTIGVSKSYLSDIFHQELGISPWDYLNRYRVLCAKNLLRTTDSSISTIASQVGFDDSSYFGRVFHKHVGVSPKEYRS